MIYFLNEEKQLDLQKEENSYNITSFAISCVYDDGLVEQVLRSDYFTRHNLALQKLYLKSRRLKKYFPSSLLNSVTHESVDSILTKKKVLLLYYYCSIAKESDIIAGYLCAPTTLSPQQKEFLKKEITSFQTYDFLAINQFDYNTHSLKDLTESENDFMKIIRKLVQ